LISYKFSGIQSEEFIKEENYFFFSISSILFSSFPIHVFCRFKNKKRIRRVRELIKEKTKIVVFMTKNLCG